MAYTGPFPHTNTGTTSAIIVSDKTFTGNVGNTGTITPGLGSGATGTGIGVFSEFKDHRPDFQRRRNRRHRRRHRGRGQRIEL